MWKIKLVSRSEEKSEVEQEDDEVTMNSSKNDGDNDDLDNSAQKKLKQARLPFKILSPKSSSPLVNNDSKKAVKKRKLSEDSTVEVSKSKLCKTDVKENLCEPAPINEIIVIEDSSDLLNSAESVISNKSDSEVVEEKNKNLNENHLFKKRLLNNSEDDASDSENNSDSKRKKKGEIITSDIDDCNKVIVNCVKDISISDNVASDDVIITITDGNNDDTKCKTAELDSVYKNVNSNDECVSESVDFKSKGTLTRGKRKLSHSTSVKNKKESSVVKKTHKTDKCKSKDIKTVFQKIQAQKNVKIKNDKSNSDDEVIILTQSCENENIKETENDEVADIISVQELSRTEREPSNTVNAIAAETKKIKDKAVALKENSTELPKELAEPKVSVSEANPDPVTETPRKIFASSVESTEIGGLHGGNKTRNVVIENLNQCKETPNVDDSTKETLEKNSPKTRSKCSVLVKKNLRSSKRNSKKVNKTPIETKHTSQKMSKVLKESSVITEENHSGVEKPSDVVSEGHETTPVKNTPDEIETPNILIVSESSLSEESRKNSCTPDANNVKSVTPKVTTKRRLTPKQLLKKEESEKKRREREQLKMEKELLRKEKEDKINEMKEERKRLKLEKEETKKREKEEKEKKRLMELEMKNEEKRAKEEEKKAKEDEKKAKEEEKRKREEAKEEEKRKRDEAKEEERKKKEADKRKEEKAASAFANFFTPKRSDNKISLSSSTEDVTDSIVIDKFMPFEVKVDMRLAAAIRRSLEKDDKVALDCVLQNQNCNTSDLYMNKLKTKLHKPLSDGKTWPLQDDNEDDDVLVIESEVVESHNKEEKSNCEKKRVQRPRAKLLHFHENRRPPYWGTWRKKSSVIGPRKPFGQDNAMFEYDIDSDDEWEEEEPGESLHGSDDDKESEDEYEVDNQVFVPHGYLSDEEAQDEIEDLSPEAQKAKLQFLEMEFEAEMKEKTEKLKPRLIGCIWFNNNVEDPKSVGSHIAELLLSRRVVLWGNITVPIDLEPSSSLSSSPSNTPAKSEQIRNFKSVIFPETAVPPLIKLVHGNRFKHQFLVDEFYNYMSQNSKSISELPSKNAISNKKREISEWMVFPQEENSSHPMIGRRCWYVAKDLREKFGILDKTLNDEEAWTYSLEVPKSSSSINSSTCVNSPNVTEQASLPVTPITKFTKVLSQEERQRQLTLSSKSLNTFSNEKQNCSTPLSSKKSAKMTSRKSRRSVIDAFIKSKASTDKDRAVLSNVEIIELSPEKPFSPSGGVAHNANDVKVDLSKTSDHVSSGKIKSNQLPVSKSAAKDCGSEKMPVAIKSTTVKTRKRITPICLSPMKHKKKL